MKPVTIAVFILVVIRVYTRAADPTNTWYLEEVPSSTQLINTGDFTTIKTGSEIYTDQPFGVTPDLAAENRVDITTKWLLIVDGNNLSTIAKDQWPVSDTVITTEILLEDDASPSQEWIWQPIEMSWWLFFQIFSSGLGILGNFLVIVILSQRRGQGSSADALIANLGFADFLTSLCVAPLPRASRVPATLAGELYCRFIFTSFFMWFFVSASIFTLTTISIDRFFAIVYPIQFKHYKRPSHIIICIFLLWLTALSFKCFIPITIHVDEEKHSCSVNYSSSRGQLIAGLVAFLIDFVIPTAIMLITQVLAARSLHLQSRRFRSSPSDRSTASLKLLAAKHRVLQMVFVVVLVFIVCWGPNETAYFLYNLRVLDASYLYGNVDRFLIVLAFYNSCANPIVYVIRYPQFRSAIRRLLTCARRSNTTLFEFQGPDSKAKEDNNLSDLHQLEAREDSY